MSASFLVRDIIVNVDARTWGRKPVPPQLKGASGTCAIDVGEALYMLGNLTMPNLLSPASPALFWAWLRYYLAPTLSTDLRITMDFADLDPNQKGILSDDLGVAIATKWLDDRFGGLKNIVDGRRFILQFPQLLKRKPKSKAKVGPNKCPDFVMQDMNGRWHVLECKGTQVQGYQNASLKTAVQQKHALRLSGPIKGEQLAAALFIANEESDSPTHLKIIDPDDDDPILRLTAARADEMDIKANRIAIARAFGTIGLNEMAVELSLPSDINPNSELLRPSESLRIRSPRDARYERASEQVRESRLIQFTDRGQIYRGREVEFELPPTGGRLPFRSVVIRQGVAASVIEEVLFFGFLPSIPSTTDLRPAENLLALSWIRILTALP